MRIDALRWFPSSQSLLRVAIIVGILVLFHESAIVLGENKSTQLRTLRRHDVDDDELHDEEIFRAVVKSLTAWQDRSRKNRHRVKRDEEIVCYGELGCFRDEGPFDYLDTLPSPPEEIGTKFLLFTRKNQHSPQVFSYFNYTTMYSSHFNSSIPTKIIIHGFGSTCNRIWAYDMRTALLKVVDCNVICVDWENGAAIPNYVRAAANTRLVGKQVALLLLWMNDHLGSRPQDFHLVGFSLGAHVAGFTGQDVKNLSRISGLDPAGPLFESYDPKVRLDSSDAVFVDVIHSNGDSLLMGGLGSWEPMGHVDFYPNGGRVQKGCSNLFLGAVRDFLWSASNGDGRSLCNHRRAYKFFTESVSPLCPFPAFACDSYDKFLTGACFTWDINRCGNMGYYADRLPNPKKGLLYLVTREDEPFCANQFRITIESSPSPAPISTYGGLEAIIISHDYNNETFLVTQSSKDNMIAGSVLQRMIVANSAISDPIKIQLKYTAYQGWLYSGISRWSMDRLTLTNPYGKSVSFCSRGLLLPSGIPVTITLTQGVCTNRYPPATTATNSIRPVYSMYPYDTYPTTADNNAIQITSVTSSENSTTTVPGQEDIPLNPDINLAMKPLTAVTMGTNANHHDDVGPSYHIVTDVDWSQWQPLALPNDNSMGGTPVEVYPLHGDNEDAVKPTEGSDNNSTGASSTRTDSNSSISDATIKIRICQVVSTDSKLNSNSSASSESNENKTERLECVEPPDVLPEIESVIKNDDKNSINVMSNNAFTLGHVSGADNSVQLNEGNSIGTEDFYSPTENSIHSPTMPPESLWSAMNNNSIPHYPAADPDVVLPPQLQYILYQLESQGLGPKSVPLNNQQGVNHRPNLQPGKFRPSPLSRALKPKLVILPSRRQPKVLDVANMGSGSGQIHQPAILHGSIIRQQPPSHTSRNHPQTHSPTNHVSQLAPQTGAVPQPQHSEATPNPPPIEANQRSFNRRNPSYNTRPNPTNSNPNINSNNQLTQSYSMKSKGFYLVPYYTYDRAGQNGMRTAVAPATRRVMGPPPPLRSASPPTTIINANNSNGNIYNNNGKTSNNYYEDFRSRINHHRAIK